MKKIEALIRPERLPVVSTALIDAGFLGMTYMETKGRGRQKGVKRLWRGREYRVTFWPKISLLLLVQDEEADKAVRLIQETAVTGEVGDGIVIVSPVDELMRIRTGERGVKAL